MVTDVVKKQRDRPLSRLDLGVGYDISTIAALLLLIFQFGKLLSMVTSCRGK